MDIELISKIDPPLFQAAYKWASDLLDYHIHLNNLEYAYADNDLFICLIDDQIIGLVVTSIYPSSAIINDFVISSEFRGQGHGLKLLKLLEQHLIPLGIQAIRLHPIDESSGFWQKQGFINDPSISTPKMSYKTLIKCNHPASKGEISINIWNSNLKGSKAPDHTGLSIINKLAIPCHMDWIVEVKDNDQVLYSGKAKYCTHIHFENNFVFSGQ